MGVVLFPRYLTGQSNTVVCFQINHIVLEYLQITELFVKHKTWLIFCEY